MTTPDRPGLQSWVQSISLSEPSFEDNTADADRLLKELARQTGLMGPHLDLALIRALPGLLREAEFRVEISLFKGPQGAAVTDVRRPGREEAWLGLAVDLGTTRYVLCLVDLRRKEALAKESFPNPQAEVGPDILTRIHHAESAPGLAQLQELILSDMNGNIEALCREQEVRPEQIANVALAGNTAMLHLFLGVPPRWMIREPYIPGVNVPDLLRTGEIGLRSGEQARLFCFPNSGSYFGGDLFAGIISSGMHCKEEISILVDVGTNAEVVLGNKDFLIACAGAAGPALEGGVSKIGRQAGPGIIDQVRFDNERGGFQVHAIADLQPTGICGSGVIDLASELFQAGLLDIRGKFVPDAAPELFKSSDGVPHLVLVPSEDSGTGEDLLIGQPEIDSLIRSKAAMYTILETITSSVGIGFDDLSTFYVAGTFGNFINPVSAIGIGMLPDIPLERFQPLGNSSLKGAIKVLQEPTAIDDVKSVQQRVTYLELNVNQEFMNKFSAAKFLPHTERSRFPSVVGGE